MLECPSDDRFPERPHGFGTTSYAGSGGWDEWDRGGEVYAGVFSTKFSTRIADVTDGTSNTVAVGEVTQFSFSRPSVNGVVVDRWLGGVGLVRNRFSAVFRTSLVATGMNATIAAKDGSAGSGNPGRIWGPLLRADGGGQPSGYWGPWASPHAMRPLYFTHHAMNNDWIGPGSPHPGGALFLLADSSVRFISETISNGGDANGPPNDPEGEFGNVWVSIHSVRGHANEVKGGIPN